VGKSYTYFRRLPGHKNYTEFVKDTVKGLQNFYTGQEDEFFETAEISLKTFDVLQFSLEIEKLASSHQENLKFVTLADIHRKLKFVGFAFFSFFVTMMKIITPSTLDQFPAVLSKRASI